MAMRYVQSRDSNHLFIFENMTEVVEFTDKTLYKHRDPSWVGEDLMSWEDVEKRTKEAWEFGAEVVNSFVERLIKEETDAIKAVKSRKRKTSFSEDEGEEFDYERFMNGEKFWKHTKRETREGANEITIVVDTSTPSFQSTEDILWRGGAALALTKILEERGLLVELWMTNGSKLFMGDYHSVQTLCRLKECSDPLDIQTICNTLAGWFYRSATFALLETLCKYKGVEPAYGYGSVAPPTQADLNEITLDDHRIYIKDVYSFSAAVSCVTSEIARVAASSKYMQQDGKKK